MPTFTIAYVIQASVGGLAALGVALVWFRGASAGIRNAALILGTCLATPYLQDYDMVFGALVVAWLWQDEAVRRMPEFPLFLACAAVLLIPLFAASLALATGLEWGPLFIAPLFAMTLKMRSRQAGRRVHCGRIDSPRSIRRDADGSDAPGALAWSSPQA